MCTVHDCLLHTNIKLYFTHVCWAKKTYNHIYLSYKNDKKESIKTTRPKTSLFLFGMVRVVFWCAQYAYSIHTTIFAIRVLNAKLKTSRYILHRKLYRERIVYNIWAKTMHFQTHPYWTVFYQRKWNNLRDQFFNQVESTDLCLGFKAPIFVSCDCVGLVEVPILWSDSIIDKFNFASLLPPPTYNE